MAESLQWNFEAPAKVESWDEYFNEYHKQLARRLSADGVEDAEQTVRILVQGHDIYTSELPDKLAKYAKVMRDASPILDARHSRTWHEGMAFKSGIKEGTKRPDVTADHYVIRGRGFRASWTNDVFNYGFVGAQYFPQITPFMKAVKELPHD